MRMSENGFYVEKYNKCANCGLLVYGEGIRKGPKASGLFCSPWCVEWAEMKAKGVENPRLPIVQPKLPFEAAYPAKGERLAPLDMVNMNILDSTMVSICREMGILLMKTSYSTIFNEGLDFTCALADAKGDMIACAEFCPTMIGGMPLLIKTCAQEIPFDTLEEGDILLHNDPYRGGLHCPEHTFFKPFFVDGELLGFAVCIGHIAEIGGMVPGAFCGEATEIFHEGMRVPPVKIMKAGKDVEEVWKLILANTRTPRQSYGDLRAMIGSVNLGVDRIVQIVRKYGKDVFKQTCEDLMDYAERRMRAELASFADGTYSFEDIVENDGIQRKGFTLAVDVHVQGDEVVADFSRSSEQAKGPINATLGVTTGATYNGILHVTDASIPKNSGAFRPIRVVAPPAKVVNVDYPGPLVAGNTETHPRLANIVIAAMGGCVPERVMASESGTSTNFVFGGDHPDHDEYFACYDIMSGGWGGRFGHDGNDCVNAINGNCRFNPTEVFETRFPLMVENCELIQDSGGAGEWRGGLGYQRTLLIRTVPITGSQCSDRHELKPYGLFGGGLGGNGGTRVKKAGHDDWSTVRELHNKMSTSKYANVVFEPGDRVLLITPGGGGYGSPQERDRELVQEDVAEGYVSETAARSAYGWAG
ncbi:MAG TPA: hydantoinase B/oxoprolinase family protein [Geminicoccus sp.]|jgi:5-oxoprolinase (ATP-hydrolysing)/N-methylhydantoinase B|uniref:hydantoinase B/oxoprolinase family protein n=1 Tax=Geminicoccus sp. TaxID=2024832 RepID=UPI002E2F4061|nr:hydantoinase B/oxoprolinase family protein [Geminicoccus sp.]HEX2528230.1 hydantoinase B/oxoprolinase family protein [Geminicoccus sp.]